MGVAAPSPFLLTLRGPISLRGKWFRGVGPGWWGRARFPGSHPPPASPGAGSPVGSSLPPRSGLCVGRRRLGWGRGAGKLSRGPRPLSHSRGTGLGPAAPFQAGFVLHQAPARRATGGRRKVKGFGVGGGEGAAKQVSGVSGSLFRGF